MRVIFFESNITKIESIFFFLFFLGICMGEVSRLNNADPFPLYGSMEIYNFLTSDTRRSIKESLDMENEYAYEIEEKLSFTCSPFYQTASDGVDYKSKNMITYFDNSNNASQSPTESASGLTPSTNQSITIPMPLSALKDPWNMFGLFYSSDKKDSNSQQSINNSILFSESDNRLSKILARNLGFGHVSLIKNTDTTAVNGISIPEKIMDPLNYGYFNYRNNYFNIISNPASRDPNKLFGYGYFNVNYEKYGIRAQCDLKLTSSLGVKISSGLAHLSQNNIILVDTTSNYYGPNNVHMLTITDQTVNAASNSFDSGASKFETPNIYQSTPYSLSNLDGGLYVNDYSNLPSPGGPSTSTSNPNFADQFKSQYLLNVQHNLKGIQDVLGLNFNSYQKTEIEDPTFEIYFRKLFLYNAYLENKKESIWPIYGIIPIFSLNFSCPTSSRVPSDKLFAKEISNNGHWSYGGNIGLIIDFLKTATIAFNLGASFFNEGLYSKVPVPVSIYQEGIFPYTADMKIMPGHNMTLGVSFSVDRFYDNFSFGSEYRVVKHNEDFYNIIKINNPFKIEYSNNLLERYRTNGFSVKYESGDQFDSSSSSSLANQITIFSELQDDPSWSPSDMQIQYPENLSSGAFITTANDAVNPDIGKLYWGKALVIIQPDVSKKSYSPRRFNGNDDYLIDSEVPFIDIKNIQIDYLRARSSWVSHLFNFNISYDISKYMGIAIFAQHPFSLRNGYNTLTVGCSFSMIF